MVPRERIVLSVSVAPRDLLAILTKAQHTLPGTRCIGRLSTGAAARKLKAAYLRFGIVG